MKSNKYYLLLFSLIFMTQAFICAQGLSLFQEIRSAFASNPDVTKKELLNKADKRIKFWQTVGKALHAYGLKDDSDEMKKALKYFKRAETNKSNLAGLTDSKLTEIKKKLKARKLGASRGRGRSATHDKKTTLGTRNRRVRKSPVLRKRVTKVGTAGKGKLAKTKSISKIRPVRIKKSVLAD